VIGTLVIKEERPRAVDEMHFIKYSFLFSKREKRRRKTTCC
jgi:hypothetical protein